MSQRGGDVQTNLRISSDPIASDLIPRGGADAIISLEPMEALRYLPYLKPGGWVVTSSSPVVNIPNYPSLEAILEELKALPNLLILDLEQLAKDNGVARSANILLLGAASQILEIERTDLEGGIERIFARKGEAIIAANLKAFAIGVDAVADQLKG